MEERSLQAPGSTRSWDRPWGLHSRLSIGDNHVWSVSEQLKEDFVLSPQ